MSSPHDSLEVTVARIEEQGKAIHALVEKLDDRLFDNENGIIAKHDTRIDGLESARDMVKGVLWIVGGGLTLVGSALAAHLLGH
jgi:hypothetical protein